MDANNNPIDPAPNIEIVTGATGDTGGGGGCSDELYIGCSCDENVDDAVDILGAVVVIVDGRALRFIMDGNVSLQLL